MNLAAKPELFQHVTVLLNEAVDALMAHLGAAGIRG